MALPKTKINEKRLVKKKTQLEHAVSETVGGMESLTAFQRLMLRDAISEAAYWLEMVEALQDDIAKQGVTVNEISKRKGATPRRLKENPLVLILHKVTPRKNEAMKNLYKLCDKGECVEETDERDALFSFNSH